MEEKKHMQILLIGEVDSDNVGDQLIGTTVQKLIQCQFPDIEVDLFDLSGRNIRLRDIPIIDGIKVITRYPEICFPHYKSHYIKRRITTIRYFKTLFSLIKKMSMKQYDMVMFDGGALFQDYFAELIDLVVREASRHCDKIVFHSCGLGKLSRHSILCLKKAFQNKKVVSISIRDSFQQFKELFENIPVIETVDTAINCCRFYETTLNINSKKEIGLGCISESKYFDIQFDLVKRLINSKYKWKLFTTGEPADYNMAIEILRKCGLDNTKKYLCERPTKPEDLIEIITGFDSIISFRMHSLVVAASYGIPVTGIVWDKKVEYFLKEIGSKHYINTPMDGFKEDILALRCVDFTKDMRERINTLSVQVENLLYEEINTNI